MTCSGRVPILSVACDTPSGIMNSPGSTVAGRVIAEVPTVPSQSLSGSDVAVGSRVRSARPTKSCKEPYVVGYVL